MVRALASHRILVPRAYNPSGLRQELRALGATILNNKGNNRILPIRFHAAFIYGACLKWLLPELSIPATGQKDLRLWGRECLHRCGPGSIP